MADAAANAGIRRPKERLMGPIGAVFGIVGDAGSGELEAMGHRLRHRGVSGTTWSLSSQLHLGVRGPSREELQRLAGSSFVVCGRLYGLHDDARAETGSVEPGGDGGVPSSVLSRLLERHGPQGLSKLRGHWVAALADGGGRLILAREPGGVETLHFTSCGGRVLFASESKAFYAVDGFQPAPDRGAIRYLQGRNYTPHGQTCLDGVFEVPVGGSVLLEPGRSACRYRGRGHTDAERDDRPEEEIVEDLRRRFVDTIRQRLPDDPAEPVGVLLSGGVDSASVVAGIHAADPGRAVHTFTAGWGDGDPEMEAARETADELGVRHHEVELRPSDLPEIFRRAIWMLEEPVGREDVPLCWVAIRAAAEHVDTLFSGFGPDSLFAGMQRHLLLHLMNRFPPLRSPMLALWRYSQHSEMPEGWLGSLLVRAYYGNDLWPAPRVAGAEHVPVRPPLFGPSVTLTDLVAGEDPTLARVRALHQAHGLEPVLPWKDPAIVELAARLPDRLKIRGVRQKYVLRRACEGLLPAGIRRRGKTLHRLEYGLELSRVLDDMADELLAPERLEGRGLFEPAYVADLRAREPGVPYSEQRAQRLWTLLLTEIWARTFLDRDGAAPIGLEDCRDVRRHRQQATPLSTEPEGKGR